MIAFSEASADVLIGAAEGAASRLRGQGFVRHGLASHAVTDFSGGYARAFTEACVVEAEDRGKLAGVLDDLVGQVQDAKLKAGEEKDRQEQLAAWRERKEEREREFSVESWLYYDPKPSTFPVAPPTVSAAFTPRERQRAVGGIFRPGISSADPVRLRSFVSNSRPRNADLLDELTRVRSAWRGFVAGCSWVPTGSVTFVDGFDRFIVENQTDAAWIETIAAAFEAAGGGALSDEYLASVVSTQTDVAYLTLLLSGMTPAEQKEYLLSDQFRQWATKLTDQLSYMPPELVKTWWDEWGNPADPLAPTEIQLALIAAIPTIIGNLNGVAYWARDHANRTQLGNEITDMKTQIEALEKQVAALESFARNNTDEMLVVRKLVALDAAKAALDAAKENLGALTAIQESLKTDDGVPRQLVSLTGDVPPLAAVSIGNLDTAKNITYLVPGIDTTAKNMLAWTDAGQNLYNEQKRVTNGDGDRAVVAWIRYETPPQFSLGNQDVFHSGDAREGAVNFGDDVAGLNATRAGTETSVNVVAHSYGTATVTLALEQENLTVDSLVCLASAGIDISISTAESVQVGEMFAGESAEDPWAETGRYFSGRTDPMSPRFGATPFNVEGVPDDPNLHGVTAHDTTLKPPGYGYLDEKTESLNNTALATTGQGDKVSDYHKPPSPYDDIDIGTGGIGVGIGGYG